MNSTLSESDETLPLIDRGRRDEEDLIVEYSSLRSDNQKPWATRDVLSEPRKVFRVCNCSSRRLVDCPGCSFPSDRGIIYSWSGLNVSIVSRNEKLFPWKKFCSAVTKKQEASGKPKHILKNAYGIAHPGELLAVMGASGAGKTTLLDALTYNSATSSIIEGSRRLNGFPTDRDIVTSLSAYVEQENFFVGTLSVKEHLIFHSLIRIDRNVPYRQKLERVEEVIVELGLEKCQNTEIGFQGRTKGISGGERKRLSFATEILTNPPIMFCDEPTSGLDSFMALNVINVLKTMAIRGKTVICTIHQPSSEMFSLFDKILLVAEGRTAFLGNPSEAISFFADLGASPPADYNPADFFIQFLAVVPNREEVCKSTIKLICNTFEQSPRGLEIVAKIDRNQVSNVGSCGWREHISASSLLSSEFTYPATWLCQFKSLFWRSWINIMKEPLLVKVRLFQTVVLSLMVGLIYQKQKLNENGVVNINGALFTFLTNMTFQNLYAVISVFCNELPVFMKEHSNGLYRVDAYFLSKTLAEIPMFVAIPVVFTCITYYWINLSQELYHFAFTILILVLVTNVATSFGYFISCISTHSVMALSIGPPVVIPFLLFGGFLLNAGSIPDYFKWMSYLSWFKYGNEALFINQWSDIKNIKCNSSAVSCPRTGDVVLKMYHFEEQDFWWDISSLIILILFFRLLAFFALFLKTVRTQLCR